MQSNIKIIKNRLLPIKRMKKKSDPPEVTPELTPTPVEEQKIEWIQTAGRLLLYTIGGLFLLEDYHTGLHYAKNDYSHIESSPLFKGNLFRLHAMFLEQLYHKTPSQHYQLALAIETTKTALNHYQQSGSIHGTAVSYFQLAHLQRISS